MEVITPMDGILVEVIPIDLTVVLVVGNFPEVVEGGVPSEEVEAAGSSKKIFD